LIPVEDVAQGQPGRGFPNLRAIAGGEGARRGQARMQNANLARERKHQQQ